MKRSWGLYIVGVTIVVFIAVNCSSNYGTPTQPIKPVGLQLTAVPSSALVGVGTSQNINVSGGVPPYSISAPPNGIATAQLLRPDSSVTTLVISGVTVASVSTAVTIRDSAAARTVTIPIAVH